MAKWKEITRNTHTQMHSWLVIGVSFRRNSPFNRIAFSIASLVFAWVKVKLLNHFYSDGGSCWVREWERERERLASWVWEFERARILKERERERERELVTCKLMDSWICNWCLWMSIWQLPMKLSSSKSVHSGAEFVRPRHLPRRMSEFVLESKQKLCLLFSLRQSMNQVTTENVNH